MAKNFPELWLNRVIYNLTLGADAMFLAGITELDTQVAELGENNVIHIPKSDFNPEVLINNTTYPLALQEYTDDDIIISLDKYQTKPTAVKDDKIIGASYPIIDGVTRSHTNSINSSKFKKAVHALAPTSNSTLTPVISTATAGKCTYEDLMALKAKLDDAGCPLNGRRLVLSNDHWNSMAQDRANFGNLLANYIQGSPQPVIAGFKLYQYIANPSYASGTKKAFGAVPAVGDKTASVFFLEENTAIKTGMTKQYFSEAKNDPQNQQNLLNYRHYFICLPMQSRFTGAIL